MSTTVNTTVAAVNLAFDEIIDTLQDDLYNADQSWHLHRIVATGDGTRYRVRIRRNAHDFQSWAVAERWSGSAWEKVIERPIGACVCRAAPDGLTNPHQVPRGASAPTPQPDQRRPRPLPAASACPNGSPTTAAPNVDRPPASSTAAGTSPGSSPPPTR